VKVRYQDSAQVLLHSFMVCDAMTLIIDIICLSLLLNFINVMA